MHDLGLYSNNRDECLIHYFELAPNCYKFSNFNINRWNIVHCQSNTSVNISDDKCKKMWETNRLDYHDTVKLNTNFKEELYVSIIIIVMPYYYSPTSIIQTWDNKMQGQSTHCDHVTGLHMHSKPTLRS